MILGQGELTQTAAFKYWYLECAIPGSETVKIRCQARRRAQDDHAVISA